MIKELYQRVRNYKKETILSIIYIILEVLMEAIIPFVMAFLIDKGINKSNLKNIIICGSILLIVSIISLIAGIRAGKLSAKASCGFAKNLRHDLFYKVQDYSFSNIDKFSTSSIITRLTTDVSNVQMAFQVIIRMAIRAPLMFIFSLIMAFYINIKIASIFIVIIPFLGLTLLLISKKAFPSFEKVFKTYDELNNIVGENIRGMRVVKSFVKEEHEKNKFARVSKSIYDKFCKAEILVSFNMPVMQISIYSCIILISWIGAQLIVSGTFTTGELTSMFTYAAAILTSLMMLSMIYVMCTISITSAKRITELLQEYPDIKSPKNGIKKVKNGEIEFKNVSFSYSKDETKLCLKNINLKIKSGEIIGIIGATGSSKTTLINLISRLYDPLKGEVLVGNVNVKDYDLETLRDNVSVVLQKNVLFKGTINDNLKWGNKNATQKEITEACKIAQADEFIQTFKDKYETLIEQGGTNVSGGQKQRLTIARALLKKPKIIILDDSTSAVDTATDAKIREGFKNYIPNVTKIIIAQRITSIEHADRVIVIDNGEIKDFDTPKNLLKNNDIYQEIYNSQKKGDDIQ